MKNDANDMIPADDHGKKLSPALDSHLRKLMQEKNLKQFSDQLPVEFLEDASEGLGQVKDSVQLDTVMKQLNRQMKKQLSLRKVRGRTTPVRDLSWTYWAVIIIFLLTVITFIIIRMFIRNS